MTRKRKHQAKLWVDDETLEYLRTKSDRGSYIIELIRQDRIKQQDPKILYSKKQSLIKQLASVEAIEQKPEDLHKDQDIIDKAREDYYRFEIDKCSLEQQMLWIQKQAVDKLKRARYFSYDAHQVAEIILGMDKKEGGEE